MATHTTYHSGIDPHKRACFVTTINGQGQRVDQQKMQNCPDALR